MAGPSPSSVEEGTDKKLADLLSGGRLVEPLTSGLLCELEQLVWAGCARTAAWTQQPLGAFPLQPMNGPCGVLSCYSAELMVMEMERRLETDADDRVDADVVFRPGISLLELERSLGPERHVEALARILERCAVAEERGVGTSSSSCSKGDPREAAPIARADPVFRVCVDASFPTVFAGGPKEEPPAVHYVTECVGLAALKKLLLELETSPSSGSPPDLSEGIASFRSSPLGCLRLVYSMVLTRGLSRVRKDAGLMLTAEGLICPPFGVCSSELMAMFYSGRCCGNFAVNPGIIGSSVSLSSGDRHLHGKRAETNESSLVNGVGAPTVQLPFGLLTNLDGYLLAML